VTPRVANAAKRSQAMLWLTAVCLAALARPLRMRSTDAKSTGMMALAIANDDQEEHTHRCRDVRCTGRSPPAHEAEVSAVFRKTASSTIIATAATFGSRHFLSWYGAKGHEHLRPSAQAFEPGSCGQSAQELRRICLFHPRTRVSS